MEKFFNESIRIKISKRELLSLIIKTQNVEYINYWKDLVSKNIFNELLYRYSTDIQYMLTQIEKPAAGECAKYGNLRFLKYLHENNYSWNRYICYSAVENGHLDCLKYAYENGCEWNSYICHKAAENGRLEILKYAHENGCPWSSATFF